MRWVFGQLRRLHNEGFEARIRAFFKKTLRKISHELQRRPRLKLRIVEWSRRLGFFDQLRGLNDRLRAEYGNRHRDSLKPSSQMNAQLDILKINSKEEKSIFKNDLVVNNSKLLVIRGDINSYSGYARVSSLIADGLGKDFDLIFGIDLHFHPEKYAKVWSNPLILDENIDELRCMTKGEIVVLTISTPDNFKKFEAVKNKGMFFWETNRLGNESWVEIMNEMDEIFVPAKFMKSMLCKEGVVTRIEYMPCPVTNITNCEENIQTQELLMKEIVIGDDFESNVVDFRYVRAKSDFLLFTVGTFIPRKGYPILAEEWINYAKNNINASLVIKTSSIDVTEVSEETFKKLSALFNGIAKKHKITNIRVYVVLDKLPSLSLKMLESSCDAYVTMAYGEGLGLGVFESLLMGKPVICPRHTSFKEYLPKEYPYFLETEFANFGLIDPVDVYPISAQWGVPCEGSLGKVLKRLLDDIKDGTVSNFIEEAVSNFKSVCK